MKKLIIASRNRGKLKETSEILKELALEVISMEEAGIFQDIDEYGSTFEENALIKAQEIARMTGEMVMADDSGLEVDYLDGAPGVYSARFAGAGATDEQKNSKLLGLLNDVPYDNRTARFVCAIAVVFPDRRSFTVKGSCEGYIGFEPKGDNGFGYDPLFYLPQYDKTMAQIDSGEKNRISHRGKALKLMVEEMKRQLSGG